VKIQGKYNTADVFNDHVEASAMSQIIELLNQEFVQGSSIKIMPDVHAGAGCVVGTTMTLHGKVVPNLVGVDIGCGVEVRKLCGKPDFKKLDKVILDHVPSGFNVRSASGMHRLLDKNALASLKCVHAVDLRRAHRSVGTLGGGNHFIEIDVDSEGKYWLVVHSGSRNLGKQVAEHYQAAAVKQRSQQDYGKQAMVDHLKAEGRAAEISDAIKALKIPKIPQYLAYLDGDLFRDYLHDMEIVQDYARRNRAAIIETIDDEMEFAADDHFETVHNYVDLDHMVLRKGAVAAYQDQRLVIPLNMRDGTLLCRGLGNPDWNFSAPHGAGRAMGRAEAKRRLSMDDFRETMQGVYSTCVDPGTLDEAPGAYKPAEEIQQYIGDTVEVLDRWKPVYNFKAREG
jgi:RNA-splicing ligase RtcB